MWKCEAECLEGVLILRMDSADDAMHAHRDIAGSYGGETWIEFPKGVIAYMTVRSLARDGRFVIGFDVGSGMEPIPGCMSALLTALEMFTAWLRLGGVSTQRGSA